MDARGRPRPPERNDVSDFGERQPEPPRLPYEREQHQHVSGIPTVARGCPAGRRKDASRLVQAKRLAAHAAPRRHLPDEQALGVHGQRISPAPRGKVKWRGMLLSTTDGCHGPDARHSRPRRSVGACRAAGGILRRLHGDGRHVRGAVWRLVVRCPRADVGRRARCRGARDASRCRPLCECPAPSA